MKTKKIITATLLSAGLILGSTSAAFATDPTPAPTATVTLSAFQVQLVAYGTALAAYDSATVTFKAQVIVFGTALQAYKTAPAGNSSAIVTFKAALSAYQTAVMTYKTSYANAVGSFKVTLSMREDLRRAINIAFENAIHTANATFATAMGIATTADQKLAATTARQNAVASAISVRKAALDAVGDKPAAPKKLIKMGDRDKKYKADKPRKSEKSDKSKKSNEGKNSNHS